MNIKTIIPVLCFFVLPVYNTFSQPFNYPQTKKVNQADTYFGKVVQDPYRWLEDDKSAETAEWVKQQNALTFDYLSKIPYRDSVKERMSKLWNYIRYKPTIKTGGVYFYFRQMGLENQFSVWYQKELNRVGQLFIDPNKVDSTGKFVVTTLKGSHDGKWLAFMISRSGSDWQQIRVKEIRTAKTIEDSIDWVKFSNIAWLAGGFYYSGYDKPTAGDELTQSNKFHKVFYHTLAFPQSQDRIVYEDTANAYKTFSATTTDDEKYLIIKASTGTSGNTVIIKNLKDAVSGFREILSGPGFSYDVIDVVDNKLWVRTNDGAPKWKLIAVDPANPQKEKWKEIIPQQNDAMESVNLCGGKIVVKYLHNASHKLLTYDMTGKAENEVQLPTYTTIDEITGDKKDSLFYFSATTFTKPTVIYKYLIAINRVVIQYEPKIDFAADSFVTKQVWYTSKDGTKIPMFIVHKKGLKLEGKNPTMLFGYGGFNISKTPEFKVERLVFLEHGGVFAMPNIRGGGEFGEDWHKAGTKLKKQNVFDDFIAAAEYLIKEKYTSSSKLAISGRSNGGLLVGACMTQRPDLFKVALPAVGVMDMLRYDKFTIGWAWKSDYGSSEKEDEFNALYKYSPLHNIKKDVKYPATLVTTADHDDRVVPAHSFKFISTLQEYQTGNNPALIRIDTDAGHGSGKPTKKLIDEQADVFSFMMYNLGMSW